MINFYKDSNTRGLAILATILCVLFIICAVWFIYMGTPAKTSNVKNNFYALATVVYAVDEVEDVVTCEDYSGNLWDFYGVENWKIGDNVNLLMNDCGTTEIYDDEICGISSADWIFSKG